MSAGPPYEETRTPSSDQVRRRGRFAAVLAGFGLAFVGVAVVTGSAPPLAFSAVLFGVAGLFGALAAFDARYASVETVVDEGGVRIRRTLGAELDLDPANVEGVEVVENADLAANAGPARRFSRRAFLTGNADGQGVRIRTGDDDVVVATGDPDAFVEAVEDVATLEAGS